ncbi:HpcH/HpaI aldolase [Verticillium alfalfae VaMs.102]|uniref:HpcH/HpaI aldolase n=1 Tax=Verticillium alfalfae (strain VaMs.102 / ATCC MYA-4576 / FGSC 10136) TaxID=526221 RepID=C9SIW7_VERA1|nr:HpcH/HpaI aldolase [Verticillium alfalfae VaMs.102]EEY18890.1 HpcH/HpaI aldolase [Verticillium alfalfae VaMs.102]
MGIIVPHIHGVEDARRVIDVAKSPLVGHRSISAGFPQFEYAPLPAHIIQSEMNATGSVVFIMIETADALEAVEDIAALPGCDVLLVANDLACEIGTLPDWEQGFYWSLETRQCGSKGSRQDDGHRRTLPSSRYSDPGDQ